MHRLMPVCLVCSFNEAPLSFHGDFLQLLVLEIREMAEGTLAFESNAAVEPKRMLRYLPPKPNGMSSIRRRLPV